jgi:alkylated DNA repair protein (DNA oxidative demethylase)
MIPDLFASQQTRLEICPGAFLLRSFAEAYASEILSSLQVIESVAPFRHMVTPGGLRMSVAMTNCGEVGWLTDRAGYRYDRIDPTTGRKWPDMPPCFRALANRAADQAGYPGFVPDACLINRYTPGTKLTLHQDRDERDFAHPIVSVSLGLPAIFQFGGLKRRDLVRRFTVCHGDVVVWGNEARLSYHGVAELKDGEHPRLGALRINLTFRRAE